jgi:uncharacterized protein YjiS (DUF1127 family)
MTTLRTTVPVCCETTARQGGLDWIAGLFKRALDGWHERAAHRERRTAFLTLARLDDRALDDIGLQRHEVETAANLPLEINASLAVRQMAADRRAHESRMRRR